MLETNKAVKEMNRKRFQMFRRDIKKALWMLEKNKEFYKLVEKLVGSQFTTENGLHRDLIQMEQCEEKEENGEIDEFDLRNFHDMMVKKTRVQQMH